MKLRILLVFVMVTALLAVYYIYGTDYLKNRKTNTSLTAQIAAASGALALVPPAPTDLEQRQAAASAELEAQKNTFPLLPNTTQVVNDILKLAEAAGVKAVPLTTSPWATAKVNNLDFPVFRLSVAAAGTYSRLADFIRQLESSTLETMVIINLTADWENGLSANTTEALDARLTEAVLSITVYSRPSFDKETLKVDTQ